MARNLFAALLLLAAIAGIAAQDGAVEGLDPATGEVPVARPDPVVVSIDEPVPIAVTDVPVASAPLPSKPAFDPNLLVKPEDVTATMAFLDTVFKANPNVQEACLADKIITDYYALSVINCDRAQSLAEPGAPVTACPEACQTGVTVAGPECIAAMNVAYIKDNAAAQGPNFTLPDFDPTDTLAACNIVVDEGAKAFAYEIGQTVFLAQSLQNAGVTVPECGDFAALQSLTYVQNKIACAEAPNCNERCQDAVAEAGEACLKALENATATSDTALYNAQFQMFEKCNIAPPEEEPEVVPSTPANATPAETPAETPPAAPVSGAASASAAAGIAAAVAMLLL